jgi:CRISPR-associated protein Cas1
MAILYLTEQQAWVGHEGECLVVHIPVRNEDGTGRGKRERKMTVPLFKVEEVMVLGDITLTTPALASLLDAKVPITYLSRHGRYLGSLHPMLSRNSLLRLAQYAAYNDSTRRQALAQQFVVGKLRNMRTLLMRYQRSHLGTSLQNQIESVSRCIRAAERANGPLKRGQEDDELEPASDSESSPPLEGQEVLFQEKSAAKNSQGGRQGKMDRMHGLGSLLGCEGAGSAAYFQGFGQLIRCGWSHGFSRRMRRPPTDPVNALLSYGYVILTAQVASVLASVGFDPYIGYLHASRYGKPALALDLMEEFRPLIVDSVVLGLLNNRQLEPKDFLKELNSFRMTEATRRLFLQKFEDRMQEVITHPVFGYKVAYRRCIELQARLLGKYLTGEVNAYTPFAVR